MLKEAIWTNVIKNDLSSGLDGLVDRWHVCFYSVGKLALEGTLRYRFRTAITDGLPGF